MIHKSAAKKGARKQRPTVPKPTPKKPTLKFGIFELGDMYSRVLREDGLNLDLSLQLQNLIGVEAMRHKWTQEEKDVVRHRLVREGRSRGKKWISGGGAFAYAADKLKDHPAAGGPYAMEASYKTIQKKLR